MNADKSMTKPGFTPHPHLSPKILAAVHELESLTRQVEQACKVEKAQVKICNLGLYVICATVEEEFCLATGSNFVDCLNQFDRQVRGLRQRAQDASPA